MILPPSEVICYVGDICEEIYIIQYGFCKELTGSRKLIPGNSINVMEAMLNFPVIQTIVTQTYCKLLCIPFSQLKYIFSKYSLMESEIQGIKKKYVDGN